MLHIRGMSSYLGSFKFALSTCFLFVCKMVAGEKEILHAFSQILNILLLGKRKTGVCYLVIFPIKNKTTRQRGKLTGSEEMTLYTIHNTVYV